MASLGHNELTHWGRVTHICVSKLTIIGSDNGLSPGRRQAIIWTNAGILLIRTLGTNFSEILSTIHAFSSNKMHLKMSSAKWSPFCLGLNVLRFSPYSLTHCSVDKLVDIENIMITIVDLIIYTSSICVCVCVWVGGGGGGWRGGGGWWQYHICILYHSSILSHPRL